MVPINSATIAEIFLSLQGEGTPLILLKPQIFLRFGGCNLAESEFGTKGCIWCDTPLGKAKPDYCRVERIPASGKFIQLSNPVPLETVLKEIQDLSQASITPNAFFSNQQPSEVAKTLLTDLQFHIPSYSLKRLEQIITSRLEVLEPVGVSFTGGEPLHQFSYAREAAQRLSSSNCELHLETNASIPDYAEECAELFDTCSADIKERTAGAAKDWRVLAKTELEFIERFLDAGNPNIFAKLVITNKTALEDVNWIAERIAAIGTDLMIQPVTPIGRSAEVPSFKSLEELEAKILEILGNHLWISVQMHKLSFPLL
ncbi:MAG: hypothetical protein ACFFB3_08740 [Candidatus Hodarchaeota archaeon]